MFHWLFNAHDFITRDHCGKWSDSLVFLYQLANFLIFLAYFAIPLALFSLWREVERRPTLKEALSDHTRVVLMFMFFILSCGFGHLMNVFAFSWPAYRFFTLVDIVTAILSIPTALMLPGIIRVILRAGIDEKT